MKTTTQLHAAMMSNPHTYPIFGGIYPRDRLPSTLRKRRPIGIIANTHKSHQPGQHWIAFHIDRQGHLTYFDSYGLPPTHQEFIDFIKRHSPSYTYNAKRVQGHDTTCGMYCLYFLLSMARQQRKMLHHLYARSPQENDVWIRRWAKNVFKFPSPTPAGV